MFERYTEPARRALFFARYEATLLGAAAIESEHILLGVIRGSDAVVGRILVDAGMSYQGVRKHIDEVTKTRPRSKIPTSVEMPFTEETKRVLKYAAEEADRLVHRQIGTEHLLLALLRERGAIAERSLAQHLFDQEIYRHRDRNGSQCPIPHTTLRERLKRAREAGLLPS